MSDMDVEIVKIFLTETVEQVDELEKSLLDIESGVSSEEIIHKIFRIAHTIKGSAKCLGFNGIAQLSHTMENVLQGIKNKRISLSKQVLGVMFKTLDVYKEYTAGLQADPNFLLDTTAIERELQLINSSVSENAKPEKIKDEYYIPTIGELLLEEDAISFDQIGKAVEQQEKQIGEILIDQGAVTREVVEKAIVKQKELGKPKEEFMRVSLSRLDNLINYVGELIIYNSMIKEYCMQSGIAEGKLLNALSYMEKVINEIQDLSMNLRMIPLRQVFQKMQRIVRDLSTDDKPVKFVMEGEDVELDKTVVDVIGDPLTHLIRNGIDHGLETAEERKAKGKPEIGTLLLKAEQKESNVHIIIKDDGRGIDRQRVLEKAIKKGLASPKQVLTDVEVFDLLTRPGFSTRDTVTDVSGRGVGLDVVKTSVEQLKGTLRIESVPNQGSTFNLTIPLSLSIIDGMVIYLDDIKYVVPMDQLVETINHEKFEAAFSTGKGKMINLRGEVLPVLDLVKMVHGTRRQRNNTHNDRSGLVVTYNNHKVSLEVTKVDTQQQIVIKKLGEELLNIPGVIGGFILGDGEAGLILNLYEVIQYNSHLVSKSIAEM